MIPMNDERLNRLRIDPAQRHRPESAMWAIYLAAAFATLAALYLAWPLPSDNVRVMRNKNAAAQAPAPPAPNSNAPTPSPKSAGLAAPPAPAAQPAPPAPGAGTVLTVSGYIINRERIELSPRFIGTVRWIGVRKGDLVKKGQILARLDDTDQKAQFRQAEGALNRVKAELQQAELRAARVKRLVDARDVPIETWDEARLKLDATRAAVAETQGAFDYAKAQLDWTVISSPVDGVILEKLADENELVTPQSFGGNRGPSTAILAVADPSDLQVEIDLNESDIAKVSRGQPCHIYPEAYPNRQYQGRVAEIAPEASREKGTLQVKVQIDNPDHYLTPEASARVDFLATGPGPM